MNKFRLPYAIALALIWAIAYMDWLQPGYMQFGLPAAWDKPLSTKQSFDLAQGAKNTMKCTALETVPDWAKPSNWRLGLRTEEPKTCTERLREKDV